MSRDEHVKERNLLFGGSAIFRRTLAADDGLITGSVPAGPPVLVSLLTPFPLRLFLNHRRQLRVQQRRFPRCPNIENRIAAAAEKSCGNVALV